MGCRHLEGQPGNGLRPSTSVPIRGFVKGCFAIGLLSALLLIILAIILL